MVSFKRCTRGHVFIINVVSWQSLYGLFSRGERAALVVGLRLSIEGRNKCERERGCCGTEDMRGYVLWIRVEGYKYAVGLSRQ